MHRPDPAAGPNLFVDPHHGVIWRGDSVKEKEIDAGHQHDEQQERHNGSRVVERIVAPSVNPVE
jgi:hypothetical protein